MSLYTFYLVYVCLRAIPYQRRNPKHMSSCVTHPITTLFYEIKVIFALLCCREVSECLDSIQQLDEGQTQVNLDTMRTEISRHWSQLGDLVIYPVFKRNRLRVYWTSKSCSLTSARSTRSTKWASVRRILYFWTRGRVSTGCLSWRCWGWIFIVLGISMDYVLFSVSGHRMTSFILLIKVPKYYFNEDLSLNGPV